MKSGFSLLLACVALAAGVAILLFDPDLVRPFGSANVIVRQEPEPPPEASSTAKTKPAPKPARSRVPQTRPVVEPAPAPEVSTGGPAVAGGQIPAAKPDETTAKTYGGPALSIQRVDRGHDLETLVYARDRGKQVTVISLEDGKVSSHSQSGIAPALDSPGTRPDEHTAVSLARPTELQPASIAIPPAAEAPKSIPKAIDKTLAEAPAAAKPPGRPPVQGNVGTCGEYRDGKLTVKPCSQVPLSPGEWLAKGSATAPDETVPAGNRR